MVTKHTEDLVCVDQLEIGQVVTYWFTLIYWKL